jgi:catechol 2,3-dioxygenase-like lactoylglutathione lyase family enzyme
VTAPRFGGFSVATRDAAASAGFYRALGLVVEDKHGGGRTCVDAPNQHFDLDDAEAVPQWNAGWNGSSVTLGFEVDDADQVDAVVERLRALGYAVQQEPYDAPWGRRYAVVQDPDGNPIGLMSAG